MKRTFIGKNSVSAPACASNSKLPELFASSTAPMFHSMLSPLTSYTASNDDTLGSSVSYGIVTVTSFKASPPVSSYSTVILNMLPESSTHTRKVIGGSDTSSGRGDSFHFITPMPIFEGKPLLVSVSCKTLSFLNTALSTLGWVISCAPRVSPVARSSLICVSVGSVILSCMSPLTSKDLRAPSRSNRAEMVSKVAMCTASRSFEVDCRALAGAAAAGADCFGATSGSSSIGACSPVTCSYMLLVLFFLPSCMPFLPRASGFEPDFFFSAS